MAAFRFAQPEPHEKELPPACAEECIWYEPVKENLACVNRHEIICSQYRIEIFKIEES
jgi:hypothetical protein